MTDRPVSTIRVVRAYAVFSGSFDLTMPQGAQVLGVEVVHDAWPALLVLEDPSAPLAEARAFRLLATGEPFDLVGLQYVGSFSSSVGGFHLFERVAQKAGV